VSEAEHGFSRWGMVIGARRWRMRPASFLTTLVAAGAIAVYFVPAPAGVTQETMHAAALVLLTVGLWAIGTLPEYVVGLIFFTLAMILAVAPADVVFSGFASSTLWLVLGGLVIATAVQRSGLADQIAGALFERFMHSYAQLVAAVVVLAIVLSFLIPATVSRTLLLVPIAAALAERVGFERGSTGYYGLVTAAIMATYQCGTTVLTANAPNLVLAGSAEALYRIQITYAEYLWVQFPVLGLLKGSAIVGFVCWLFRAQMRPAQERRAPAPLTPEQWRTLVILVAALGFWVTDFLHGIKAGWIGMAAAVVCLLPRVGVMPPTAFADVRLGVYFYIGATLGLGLVTQTTGLSQLLGQLIERALPLEQGADFANFIKLSLFSTFAGMLSTNPAQPAVLSPLAEHFSEATGWPLRTVLMTFGIGFTTFLLPYQVPPVLVGMQVGGVRLGTMLRLSLPLAAFGIVLMLPLQYLWWRVIGYFG
jgi:anion transporter